MDTAVNLLWIPLGAGQRVVRSSGKLFEALSAAAHRRQRCNLYHSALVITVPDGRYTIEMTPVPDFQGELRGVVAGGTVGVRLLGRLRTFRYEIRCWRDGVIPDVGEATTVALDVDRACAERLLELVPSVPTPVWGRDELDSGDMWNSNSVVSWLLRRGGVDVAGIDMPTGGRAPGWSAGLVVAEREQLQVA